MTSPVVTANVPSKTAHKILIVSADSTPTGVPRHIVNLIKGFEKRSPKLQITLLCPSGWLADASRSLVTVHEHPFAHPLNQSLQRSLAAIIDEINPDLLHVHGVRAGFVVRLAIIRKFMHRRPLIYTEHQWTNDFPSHTLLHRQAAFWLMRRLDQVTTHTIAVSQAVADFLINQKISQTDKITIIPNGVSDTDQKMKIVNCKLKIGYVIGSVGSLLPIKGYSDLISAMPLILQNLPQTRLEIVGDGPDRAKLLRLIDQLGLRQQVQLIGPTESPEKYLQNWDLFVSTSRSESFGLAIAEAMAAGLPVIAMHAGAISELVTAETGRLVPLGDNHELAKAIVDLLPQMEQRHRLGEAGIVRIRSHFSLDQMVEATRRLYDAVLES